jgi:hypothetical protein
MNYLKIAKRIFTENKDLTLKNKLYIVHTYITNLKNIKKNYSYHFHRFNFNEFLLNKKIENKNFGIDFKKELADIKYKIYKQRLNFLTSKIMTFVKKFNLKYLLDLKNSQNNIEILFDFLTRHITIYKRSIQELVEGQREVTQNKNFKFEDGETVQQKMDKFDEKIKDILHIKNKK